MISVIVTAYREPQTIGKAIRCLADRKYSGISEDFEVLLVCPDRETAEAGQQTADNLKLGSRFRVIKDPQEGKPIALNLAFEKAAGEILVLSDGDVYAGPGAVGELIKPLTNREIGGVSGRPIADHPPNSIWNYWAHVLADGAHYQRQRVAGTVSSFFPMSGYLLAICSMNLRIPDDALVDDAYISYRVIQQGYRLAYAPAATVLVKYPQSLSDYLKQKKRSVGGYIQLKHYPEIKQLPQTRSMWQEIIGYTGFALRYSRTRKEVMWSTMLFPIRAWLWLLIFWERHVLKKEFRKTWVRIESTK